MGYGLRWCTRLLFLEESDYATGHTPCMQLSEIYSTHHAEKNRYSTSVLEEERAEWFIKHTPQGKSWLDLGCRDGKLTSRLMPHTASLVGVDVDPVAIQQARERIPQAKFQELNLLGDWKELAGQTFDVIICSEVMEHVYFPERVAERVRDHLKPGGIFVGSVPNAFFVKHRLRYLFGSKAHTPLQDPTHITQFHAEHLTNVLKIVGDEVVIDGYTRPPFAGLAHACPRLFAFNFLFSVKKALS